MLEKIKRRLGITDNQQDTLLNDLIEDSQSHFKLLTGAGYIDTKYDFIIVDVVSKRYQRKGSEAMKSESVDGYSVTYADGKGDFDEYMPLLANDFELLGGKPKRGKVMFL